MRHTDETACASRKSTSVQHNTFGLPCGVLVVDCPLHQGYKVSVVMACASMIRLANSAGFQGRDGHETRRGWQSCPYARHLRVEQLEPGGTASCATGGTADCR